MGIHGLLVKENLKKIMVTIIRFLYKLYFHLLKPFTCLVHIWYNKTNVPWTDKNKTVMITDQWTSFRCLSYMKVFMLLVKFDFRLKFLTNN